MAESFYLVEDLRVRHAPRFHEFVSAEEAAEKTWKSSVSGRQMSR